jgi:ribonucleoside-diphosphate reductase beta chain
MLAISQIEISVKKFWTKLGERFPKAEFDQVGVTFGESEVRHSDAYSHLLEVLGLNNEFDQLLQNPVIQGRVDYLTKYLKGASDNSDENYTLTLTLFSIFIENVSLFSQFLIIKSFNKYMNCLKDIDNVVQATQLEENIHALLGVYVIKIIQNEFPEWFNEEFYNKLYRACKKAYEAESKIIDWIFEAGELSFLPKENVKEYIKHRFNASLEMVGGKKVFDVDPSKITSLKWFEDEIHAEVNTDFFHKKPVTYSKNAKPTTAEDLF